MSKPATNASNSIKTVEVTLTYRATVTFDGSRIGATNAYNDSLACIHFASAGERKDWDESEVGIAYSVALAEAIGNSPKAIRELAINKVLLDLEERISRGDCAPVYDGNASRFSDPETRAEIHAHLPAEHHESFDFNGAISEIDEMFIDSLVRGDDGRLAATVKEGTPELTDATSRT